MPSAIISAEPARRLPVRITTWLRGAWKTNHASSPKGCPITGDVFVEIADHMTDPRDILNMCLTSKYMYYLLLQPLYSNVELKGIERCRQMLTILVEHPDICGHIRKLVLRPNWIRAPSQQGLLDEAWVAQMVANIAVNLPGLRTFEWDGLEMPTDRMWLTLRTFCPRLKNIASSIGTVDPITNSHLFDFKDLVSFSLMVKWREVTQLHGLGERPIEQFPEPLWQMLLTHSPNLETLAIATTPSPPRFYDVRPVAYGRWPRLRNLTLGNTLMENETSDNGDTSSPFVNFLFEHPTLETLSLPGQRHSIHPQNRRTSQGFPATLAFLPPSALCLDSFSGSFFAIRELPYPAMLKHLSLACEDHPSFFIPKLCKALRRFSSLVSLKIWIDMSHSDPTRDETDHGKVFHSILMACPKLLHFDLICSTKSKLTFRFEDLSYALRDSPQLKTLMLTKVHKFTDEDMIQGTARLARDNPNLERIEIKTAQSSWCYLGSMSLRKIGKYDVVHDDRGLAVSILADEWGLGLLSRVSRRYMYSLVPMRALVSEKIGGLLRRS